MTYIPTHDVTEVIRMIKDNEITLEQALKEFQRNVEIYSNCTDGSKELAEHCLQSLKEVAKNETNRITLVKEV